MAVRLENVWSVESVCQSNSHGPILGIAPSDAGGLNFGGGVQRRHDAGNHLLVLEGSGFTYLSVPPINSKSLDEGKLCFLDHRMESPTMSDMCCLREAGHVHAHVHHGDVTEDVLLEQVLYLPHLLDHQFERLTVMKMNNLPLCLENCSLCLKKLLWLARVLGLCRVLTLLPILQFGVLESLSGLVAPLLRLWESFLVFPKP